MEVQTIKVEDDPAEVRAEAVADAEAAAQIAEAGAREAAATAEAIAVTAAAEAGADVEAENEIELEEFRKWLESKLSERSEAERLVILDEMSRRMSELLDPITKRLESLSLTPPPQPETPVQPEVIEVKPEAVPDASGEREQMSRHRRRKV